MHSLAMIKGLTVNIDSPWRRRSRSPARMSSWGSRLSRTASCAKWYRTMSHPHRPSNSHDRRTVTYQRASAAATMPANLMATVRMRWSACKAACRCRPSCMSSFRCGRRLPCRRSGWWGRCWWPRSELTPIISFWWTFLFLLINFLLFLLLNFRIFLKLLTMRFN